MSYNGGWKEGRKDGTGLFKSKCTEFEGIMKEDAAFRGKLKHTFQSNARFEGSIDNCQREGPGVYFFVDGTRY